MGAPATAGDLAQQAAKQNVFEQSAATGGSYVPREQRNKKQHAMHSVAKKAARATEIAGMQGRNAPPTVPRRVLDVLGVDDTTLDSDRTFRRGVSEKLPKVPQLAEEVEPAAAVLLAFAFLTCLLCSLSLRGSTQSPIS